MCMNFYPSLLMSGMVNGTWIFGKSGGSVIRLLSDRIGSDKALSDPIRLSDSSIGSDTDRIRPYPIRSDRIIG